MYPVSLMAFILGAVVLGLPSSLQAQSLTTIYTFGGSHGGNPDGFVEHGSDLFGTTYQGGKSKNGVVFKLDSVSNVERTLYEFAGGADGSHPRGVPLYQAGILYGVTEAGGTGSCTDGCGTVFSLNAATGEHVVLHNFAGGQDGQYPSASLVGYGGFLYGTTVGGGAGACPSPGCGTVFKIDPMSGSEVILHSFDGGADGQTPLTALTVQNGLLYGTTQLGGAGTKGTVFSVDPTTGAEIVLHDFAGGTDGASPSSALTSHDDILFGATAAGGEKCHKYGCGTVYSFDPASGTETVIYSFCCNLKDGADPGQLLFVGPNIYGTTNFAGAGVGSIYEIFPSGGRKKTLYSFTGGSDGAFPGGPLVHHKGAIYGTTANGGAANLGTAFKLTLK